jgi:hypothetical protein
MKKVFNKRKKVIFLIKNKTNDKIKIPVKMAMTMLEDIRLKRIWKKVLWGFDTIPFRY